MDNNTEYFNKKWVQVINSLPNGGQYRFDLRKYGYDIIIGAIERESKVFDYACGLGVIDIGLKLEKECDVYGCDTSITAIDYISDKIGNDHFKVTNEIFGNRYDYIIATYFIEHIKDPVKWMDEMFDYGKQIIVAIPNNFARHGEHVDMAWSSWDSFHELFKKFKLERIDQGLYPDSLCPAFQHPIFKVTLNED